MKPVWKASILLYLSQAHAWTVPSRRCDCSGGRVVQPWCSLYSSDPPPLRVVAVLRPPPFRRTAGRCHPHHRHRHHRPRGPRCLEAVAPQQLGCFEVLRLDDATSVVAQEERNVVLDDWTSQPPVPFEEAWDRQRHCFQGHAARLERATRKAAASHGKEQQPTTKLHSSFWTQTLESHGLDGIDRVFFLQHTPVYTLGTASDPAYILDFNTTEIPIVRMDRGGEVTYHGPGQLVVYPILDLRHYRQDIHWYMRALEEVVIVALRDFGLAEAVREDGVTGVWVRHHKVAAMGVKCRKWITQHGLAINVEPISLQGFARIVPCGLEGREVGCVSQFAGRLVTVSEFTPYVQRAMEHVFRIQLVNP